jgi:hypothetical protein
MSGQLKTSCEMAASPKDVSTEGGSIFVIRYQTLTSEEKSQHFVYAVVYCRVHELVRAL